MIILLNSDKILATDEKIELEGIEGQGAVEAA